MLASLLFVVLFLPASAAKPLKPGINKGSIEVGSIKRSFTTVVPLNYTGTEPTKLPLVISLHGYWMDSKEQMDADQIGFIGQREGFVVVYPLGSCDSTGQKICSWNVAGTSADIGPIGATCNTDRVTWGEYPCYTSCGSRCTPPNAGTCIAGSCEDDVQFLDTMLDHLLEVGNIDSSRVYLTGFSTGGLGAYWVGQVLSRRFAAIAPNAGSTLLGYNIPPSSPMAILDTSGMHDRTVPRDVATSKTQIPGPFGTAVSKDGFYYVPTRNLTKAFAQTAQCDGVAPLKYETALDGVDSFECTQPFGKCANGVMVVECAGYWGHVADQFPSAPARYDRGGGHNSAWAEVAWAFFKQFHQTSDGVSRRVLGAEQG
jgi:poly(3-hydroxybutyrate) depolymerase